MASIKKVFAYEIIDSRGFPTIEARLWLDDDREVVTSIPAGTSVGKYEALELRDADTQRFRGMGVLRAVNIINELIAPKLVGVSPTKQSEVDHWLAKADGSKKKEKLGANSILAVSQLFVKAAALSESIPLHAYVNKLYKRLFKNEIKVEKIPTPIFNIINGGKHANNNLEFQEFQILPSSSFSFSKAYQIGVEVFHELKEVLAYRNANISVGEEGGFSPSLSSNVDAIEVLVEALNRKNLRPGVDIFVGLDIAASHFYKNDRYVIKEINHPMSKEEFIQYLVDLTRKYAFLTLDDPLDQEDFVKFGAPSRGERVAKYNRLWQIEREELKQTK